MREHYEIETVEQMRAMADVLRLRIINILVEEPMTATQLGERLGLAPAKVHYHVKELEKVGLLEMVEERPKGVIMEKYYQTIARNIEMNNALISSPSDEVEAAFRKLLDQLGQGFLRSVRQRKEQKENSMTISLSNLYMTKEEHHTLVKQMEELSAPFGHPRGVEGEHEMVFSLIGYTPIAEPEAEPGEQTSKTWVVGAASFSRKELLKARAERRRLHVTVIGVCQFASDITPELVADTIEAISVTGKLIASPEVKAVLQRKMEQSRI